MKEETQIAIFRISGQELWLLPQKAIYWKNKDALILADLHLGKAGHFRKAGIAVPSAVHNEDLAAIDQLITKYNPATIIILGDLFHSSYNGQWPEFLDWKKQYVDLEWHLIKGNHDILPEELYHIKKFEVHQHQMIERPFNFTHIPMPPKEYSETYNLAGHLHPGVRLQGEARQRLLLPCFYFGTSCGILPAFGRFTGLATTKINFNDQVFVIAGGKVLSAEILV